VDPWARRQRPVAESAFRNCPVRGRFRRWRWSRAPRPEGCGGLQIVPRNGRNLVAAAAELLVAGIDGPAAIATLDW